MQTENETQKTSIFRKSALDRISSPEQLDRYLNVTGPGVWFPLITVMVLLLGGLVWAIFGQIDMTVNVAVSAGENGVVCYMPADRKESALRRGTVHIGDQDYVLSDVGLADLRVAEDFNADLRRTGGLQTGATVAPLKVDAELMPGVYAGVVTVESIHPISYIIN